MQAHKLPFRWTTIFAAYGLLPVNVLVFLSPAAIAFGAFSGGQPDTPANGHLMLTSAAMLGLTVPVWLLGLIIAVVKAPTDIRDHRNLTMYLEKLNKAVSDASQWPKLMESRVQQWNKDNYEHNYVSRIIVSALAGVAILNSVGNYLIFLGAALPALLHSTPGQ